MKKHPVSVRVFHWASAILILVSAAVVLSREAIEHQPTRQILLELHRQLGLLILVGLFGRLVTRFRLGLADHAPNLGRAPRAAAQVAHWVMY
jgi:cytochrome b561